MSRWFDHRTILITGASAGIGEAFARQLAPTATHLVLCARRQHRLDELAQKLVTAAPQLRVSVYACDLTDSRQVACLIEQLGIDTIAIDVLINCAGFGDVGPFLSASWHKLEEMIAVNVRALTYLTHQLMPHMASQNFGGVLNISSGFGVAFMPNMATYVGTKHFVTGFTESLRAELSSTQIVISQACPGPVTTEFLAVAQDTDRPNLPPRWVALSADECVRQILRGFARKRPMIVPGRIIRLLLGCADITPRVVLRFVAKILAKFLSRA